MIIFRDGKTLFACFYKLTGLSVGYDNVEYVCDYRIGAIKMITILNRLGKMSDAFSVLVKHQQYQLNTL